MMAGKVAVAEYGDVGKGSAMLRGVVKEIVTEIDLFVHFKRLDGFKVMKMVDAIPESDIVVTTTGNEDIISLTTLKS